MKQLIKSNPFVLLLPVILGAAAYLIAYVDTFMF